MTHLGWYHSSFTKKVKEAEEDETTVQDGQ
jgi:hypothetical protein